MLGLHLNLIETLNLLTWVISFKKYYNHQFASTNSCAVLTLLFPVYAFQDLMQSKANRQSVFSLTTLSGLLTSIGEWTWSLQLTGSIPTSMSGESKETKRHKIICQSS